MKIIFAERDRKLSASLTRLVRMLMIEPVIAYNDDIISDALVKGDVLAVFLNIELNQIDTRKIVQLTHRLTELFSVPEIPVFFMYHNEAIPRIKPLLKLSRLDDVIKPFTILDIYRLLRGLIPEELALKESNGFKPQLARFMAYHDDLERWLREREQYA